MNYYPTPAGPAAERVGQIVMHNESRDVFEITSLPDGGESHQHFGLNGIAGLVLNKKLRVSIKAMWRDYSPVKEG